MPRIITEQLIKENKDYWKFQELDLDEENDVLGWVETPERFTDIIKIERTITTGCTTIKIFHRSISITKNTDYKKTYETINKEEYEQIKKIFEANGYKKL